MSNRHTHKCCRCGRRWICRFEAKNRPVGDLQACKDTGPFKAVQVNGDGPYCDGCREREIKNRKAAMRRHNAEVHRLRLENPFRAQMFNARGITTNQ